MSLVRDGLKLFKFRNKWDECCEAVFRNLDAAGNHIYRRENIAPYESNELHNGESKPTGSEPFSNRSMSQFGYCAKDLSAIVNNEAGIIPARYDSSSFDQPNRDVLLRNSRNSEHCKLTQNKPAYAVGKLAGMVFSGPLSNAHVIAKTIHSNQSRCIATQGSATAENDAGNGIVSMCDKIEELIHHKLAQIARLRTTYGDMKVGDITISKVLGGMRDMTAMSCETSELDPNLGITYRGLSVPEILEKLPAYTQGSKCPYAESVLWLLLTGQIPSAKEVDMLSRDLGRRAKVPKHVYKVIDQLPNETHPMTQYIVAVAAMQADSVFHKAYRNKTYNRETLWKLVLEDCLDLIAKNALVVGYIYKRAFIDKTIKGGMGMVYNPDEDYASNVARFIGLETPEFKDLLRLYITAHADHEGGNVSAHAALLIGSALSDPYLSFAGALSGLSGPLHGLANQESLAWVENMVKELKGQEINVETVTKFAQETIKKGQVIPGYGHAVLRVVDPRHTAFLEFAHKRFPDDPMVKILDVCLQAIPPVLAATGKVKSPHPNVDCSTGILLTHFGINQREIYTVFFGLSRALGIASQLVWSRALRTPIERPKSHTLDSLERKCQ